MEQQQQSLATLPIWAQIALLLGGGATGTAVATQFLPWALRRLNVRQSRADCAKVEAEVEKTRAEAAAVSVTALTETIAALQSTITELQERLNTMGDEVETLTQEVHDTRRLIRVHQEWDDGMVSAARARGEQPEEPPPLYPEDATA